MKSYKIVRFDPSEARKFIVIAVFLSLVLTLLNRVISSLPGAKEAENFVLFVVELFAALIYGFATVVVFTTGQEAWKNVEKAALKGDRKLVEKLSGERPDSFPTIVMIAAWLLFAGGSLYISIPAVALPLFFSLHFVLIIPPIFAWDYWDFKKGIKRVVEID